MSKNLSFESELEALFDEQVMDDFKDSERKKWPWEKENEDAKAEILKKLPDMVSRGKKVVYPQLVKEWEKEVSSISELEPIDACIKYGILNRALEIMETLHRGATYEQRCDLASRDNGQSANTIGYMFGCIAKYSFKGAEFCKQHVPQWAEFCKEHVSQWAELFQEDTPQFEIHDTSGSISDKQPESRRKLLSKKELRKKLKEIGHLKGYINKK